MGKAYSALLRDPRWQRKRLEILQRDEWACQQCFGTDSTLHVHHRVYTDGKAPWEYEEHLLVTLCEECHNEEHGWAQRAMTRFHRSLAAEGWLGGEMNWLAGSLENIARPLNRYPPEVQACIIAWALQDDTMASLMADGYWEWLRKRAAEKNPEAT